MALGWGVGGGLVLGLALSVASTVVAAARARRTAASSTPPQGRIAVGWLIVEDLLAVVVLVLLPTIAPLLGRHAPSGADGRARGRSAASRSRSARRGLRRRHDRRRARGSCRGCCSSVARTGSRELFTLAVLAIALGIAFVASSVFGVSFALGAFLAGPSSASRT